MALANLAMPSGASAQQQPIFYPPYELYKFHMGSTNGFFYTPWYSQGANAGYSFQGPVPSSGVATGGIYPNPQNGYTPAPSTGLTPLYQWWVIQGFRSYTHLTIWLGSNGSGYHFNGVVGYVYPPSTTVDPFGNPTRKISAWYSQSYGYWYGIGEPGDPDIEFPPNGTYAWHGVVFRLPSPTLATGPYRCQPYGGIFCTGESLAQYDPPPPPPECDLYQEQSCYNSGGWWDSVSCSCNYYYYYY
jgi:hypothetical protein